MSVQVSRSAKHAHKAFQGAFKNYAEHREMMRSEACATILQTASRFMATLECMSKCSSHPWSASMYINSSRIRDILTVERGIFLRQWKDEIDTECATGMRHTLYARTTLATMTDLEVLYDEETILMEYVDKFHSVRSFKYTRDSGDAHKANVSGEVCDIKSEELALQLTRVSCMLVGMVDMTAAEKIRESLEYPILNLNKFYLKIATDGQKFRIISKVQEDEGMNAQEVLMLSKESLFVLSRGIDSDEYCGFFFLDSPIHLTNGVKERIRISCFWVKSDDNTPNLTETLVHWLKDTVRATGCKILYVKAHASSMGFWKNCGFAVHEDESIATFQINPMSLENIIN